jgi:hypothetical protein
MKEAIMNWNMKEALTEIMFLENLESVRWHDTAVRFTFKNEFELSLAFGRGSYSSNKGVVEYSDKGKHLLLQCKTVEAAVFMPNGEFFGDDVAPFVAPEVVLDMAEKVAAYEPESLKALTFDPSSTTI